MGRQQEFRNAGIQEMFSGASFPASLMSCNAYLGAFPVAEALRQGADVVITGRVVDSACTLGPLIYEYGWKHSDFDLLAQGTLAGHLIECGPQCCGGLFTDYEMVDSWVNIGYPIVEVEANGTFTVQKPAGTDGLISFGSVCEQMLYEIGDPGAYHVPDVACDFTQVQLEEVAANVVRVTSARGSPPTSTYKVCATYANGFSFVPALTVVGHDASKKAKRIATTLVTRFSMILKAAKKSDFTELRVETIGAGQFFRQQSNGSEAVVRIALRHPDRKALELVSREVACAATSFAQGITGGAGGAGIQPMISAFMFLVPKAGIPNRVVLDSRETICTVPTDGGFAGSASESVTPVPAEPPTGLTVRVPLLDLCWARSGDKGNFANIGLIARRPEYLPWLRHQVTPERVREHFGHNITGDVLRFDLPGTSSVNFLLHDTLGGGGTSSLHSDPLAKTYGQVLLQMEVDVPPAWVNTHRLLKHRGGGVAPSKL
eukprot:NODE_4497_length_1884_cov_5.381901.p1 GENE.NODE_4497_length_1884_cov_5.381901~~NODE_4497_length_1884_cov_5.381901.p1  ORF type:complete len:539 (-),score=138.67 NODE_4497_length_1884_cov_5.381901:266-1729(-)